MTPERLTTFRNGSHTFDVIDSGPIDGTPIILLHGFPQRAASWNDVSERLHAAGMRTFAPDQRGYSPGARPRTRWGYRGSQLVADLLALVDAIDAGPVHLVGHDWGAAIGWAAAAEQPASFSTYTAVSVGHPAAFVRSMVRSNQALKSYYMGIFQVPVVPEKVLSGKAAAKNLRGAGMTTEMVETYYRDIVDHGALSGGLGWYRGLPFAKPGAIGGKVSIPTTYIWSDDDVALGRKAADLTENFVTGPYRFEIIEGASHWLPDEEPDRVSDLILDRVRSV